MSSPSPAGPSFSPFASSPDEDEAPRSIAGGIQPPKSAECQLPFRSGPPILSVDETSIDVGTRDPSKMPGVKVHDYQPESDHPRVSWEYQGSKGQAMDSSRAATGQRPLTLLDLPVDILKDIFKEVRHTNDLTSLALSHSALHRLAIPHIYSRFDIVWPDTNSHAEPRSGVDALTYGLATLVMAEEIFTSRASSSPPLSMTNRYNINGNGLASEATIRKRRGNHYARFTKKFSLGNGPADWVQEYLISKEGGKMLGTLVALAIARMRSLETFIWDMPTGILRDVWLALSSLGDHDECRLEKVWVRWHENTNPEVSHVIVPPAPVLNFSLSSNPPLHISGNTIAAPRINTAALDRVEHPNFSGLPPLKSLSVLDIDELSYLDEMSVLIGRSLDKLVELRVGIANHASAKDWAMVWERESLQQVDYDYPELGSLTIGEKRLGGVLGVLTGHVCDIHKPRPVPTPVSLVTESPTSNDPLNLANPPADEWHDTNPVLAETETSPLPTTVVERRPSDTPSATEFVFQPSPIAGVFFTPVSSPSKPKASVRTHNGRSVHDLPLLDRHLEKRIRLESLELERVPLSIPVLQKAIDWTVLTSLTLLHCQNHDQLWKVLRRTFAPVLKSPTYPQPRRSSHNTPKRSARSSNVGTELEYTYSLRLKKVHTNTVSPHLISCLKDTLAPNSLEVLFLQDSRTYASPVSIEAIYRGPLRRHRLSLKKLLIDSSERGGDGLATNSSRWRRWMLNREILAFICGGKMSALREIGVALDYRDWHFFLQNLPSIPHVRSLYIPFLADHVHGTNLDPRELAMQLLDIVSLRPEVELCYLGVANKCFELLESQRDGDERPSSRHGSTLSGGGDEHGPSEDEDEDDHHDEVEEDDVEEDEDDDEPDDDRDDGSTESDHEHDDYDHDTDTNSETSESEGHESARIRLREILFYDDKVAIFKARHGRL